MGNFFAARGVFCLCLLALGSGLVAAPGALAKLPGLIAFYPFEGNAQDDSGNGLHGQVFNAVPTAGYEGQGFLFDGASSYIRAPININPTVYPRLTMGCWAKALSGFPPERLVLQTCNSGHDDRTISLIGEGWCAYLGLGRQYLASNGAVFQKWVFLAAVYDQVAQTVSLYVDDQVYQGVGLMGNGWEFLTVGASGGGGGYFHGVIDNVFLFDRALTASQIAHIRSGGAAAILENTSSPAALKLLLLN